MKLKHYILLIIFTFSITAFGQDKFLEINGFVETRMGKMLPFVSVDVYVGDNKVNSVRSDQKGYFTVKLDYGKNYRLVFVKKGMVEKRIDFMADIPVEKRTKRFKEFAMTLVDDCEGAVTDVFKEPVDVIRFNDELGVFVSDQAHVDNIQNRLNIAYSSIDKCKQETFKEKKQLAEDALAEDNFEDAESLYEEALKIEPEDVYVKKQLGKVKREKERHRVAQVKLERLTQEGDRYLQQNKLTAAKQSFSEALKLDPTNTTVKEKIQEIEQALAQKQIEKEKTAELNSNYNDIIFSANKALAEKNYSKAEELYKEAITLKPDEPFPAQKMALAQQALKQAEKQNAEQEKINQQYKDALTQGQTALQKGDFEEANRLFNSAQLLKPKDKEAKEMLAQTQMQMEAKKQSEKKALREEQERNYNEAIQKADGLLAQNEFDKAIMAYNDALKYKSSDEYAQRKIISAKNLKVKEEQAAQAKIENAFDAAIAQGNLLKNNGRFEDAIQAYNQALEIKPNEKNALTKINEAEKLLADQKLKQKEENETKARFNQLIQEADGLLASKDYKAAKTKFEEAKAIYPEETYPKNKIAEINNIQAQIQINKNYEQTIAEGDRLFKMQEWAKATEQYSKAKSILPKETYPQQKINEINKQKSRLAQEKVKAEYDKIVAEAEQQIVAGDFEDARTTYQEAQAVLPDNAYPQQRINEINEMISQREKNKIEEKFFSIMKEAETFITNKDYEKAKAVLEKAKQVLPLNPSPQNRINEINEIISQKQKDKIKAQYEEVVKQAEEQVANKNFDRAKQLYNKAAGILQDNPYPAQRINEINKMVTDLKNNARLEKYNQLITEADQLFEQEKFSEAINIYEKAKKENAESDYPQKKINEVNQTIALKARQKIEGDYNGVIAKADSYMESKQFDLAIEAYNNASKIIPERTYSQQKINEIKSILAEQDRIENDKKEKQNQYEQIINLADKFFAEKSYQLAKAEYTKALAIFPQQEYPKAQNLKITALLAEKQKIELERRNKENQISEAIKQADKLFKDANYDEAKTFYSKALELSPDNAHASSQIKRIEQIKAKQKEALAAQAEIDNRYMDFIKAADAKFESNEYSQAKALYYQALEVKPNESYPRLQIQKTKQLLASRAAANKPGNSASTEGTSKLAEISFKNETERNKYLETLKNKYKPGITIETYKEKNKTTQRCIVIRDNEAHEFRSIHYSWGGDSYVVDGKPTNSLYYRKQTKPLPGEKVYRVNK